MKNQYQYWYPQYSEIFFDFWLNLGKYWKNVHYNSHLIEMTLKPLILLLYTYTH